jgi:enediyne biosynthesis protein E4
MTSIVRNLYSMLRITTAAAFLLIPLTLQTSFGQPVQFERILSGSPGADRDFNAAWADFDGDGFVDVCTLDGRLKLHRNNGDGTFTTMTEGNAISDAPVNYGYGLIWGDYNNDGLPDLFVNGPTGFGSVNYLFHNDGMGRFTRISDSSHLVSTGANSFSSIWGDFDNDGWLDLFVGNWIGGDGEASNFLYRNDRGRGFVLSRGGVTDSSFSNAGASQGSAAGDFDGDGLLDILNLAVRPANARLFLNRGGFDFEMRNPTQDVDESDRGTAVAVADFDNDGDMDILTTATTNAGDPDQFNGLPHLWLNDGHARFTRVRDGELFAPDVIGTVGVACGDFDNDGWIDIVMSRDNMTNQKTGETAPILFHNNGDGSFSRVTEGEIVSDTSGSQTSTWADINNDGFLDLLICNHSSGQNLLMMNKGNTNHWLKFSLKGTVSNSDAIGAKVRVKATVKGNSMWQLRQITTSQGWMTSQSDMRPHFGLGDATVAELVRIEWPSGTIQELLNVPANQILHIIEPPRLSISPPGTLSWTARAEGYSLSGSADLDGPWEKILNEVNIEDGIASVTITEANDTRFYRLHNP